MRYRYIAIAAALLFSLVSCAQTTEPPPKVKALVVEGATNVSIHPLDDGGWQVTFDLCAAWPAKDFLEYLRKHMRDSNYLPDRLGEKGVWSWDEHLDTSKKDEAYVRQYIAPWSTIAGKQTALVSLQYFRLAKNDWDDKLRVYIILR